MSDVTNDERSNWRRDADVLAQLADRWQLASDTVTVTVPRAIAERATEAWERSGEPGAETGADTGEETGERATERQAAGTLALIGGAISERGRWSAEHATVELTLAVVGEAFSGSARASRA